MNIYFSKIQLLEKVADNNLPSFNNLVKWLESFEEYKVSLNLIDFQISSSKEPHLYVNDFRREFSQRSLMEDYINWKEQRRPGVSVWVKPDSPNQVPLKKKRACPMRPV